MSWNYGEIYWQKSYWMFILLAQAITPGIVAANDNVFDYNQFF